MQGNSIDKAVKNDILPLLKDFAAVLCFILIAFLFCFRISVVNGDSMKNTLVDGDYVLLLNRMIAGNPKQGDIVVISTNGYENGKPIIKRVIATEGQTVFIDKENGTVSVDGVILDEPYIRIPNSTEPLSGDFDQPIIVQKGCIFVMGDNRTDSTDSRSSRIGQIDCREVIGKAIFRIFPGDDKGRSERNFNSIGVIS